MCDAGILCLGAVVAIAERHVQQARSVEREPGAVAPERGTARLIGAGSAPVRVGDEDVLAVGERRAAVPPRAVHGGRGVARAFTRLRVGEVDQPVLRELRMQRHVQHAAEAGGEHRRQRADRRRIEDAVPDCPQAARALGDEDGAVRQKRDAPRMIEAFRQHRHVEAGRAHAEIPGAGAERIHRRRSSSALRDRRLNPPSE